jgi:hypothetical protein
LVESIAVSHVTAAGLVIAAINWLKRSEYFPWINKEQTRLLRYIGVIGAALGAGGVHYAWDPAARTLVFHIPTLAGTVGFCWEWVQQFIMQEITYQATSSGSNIPNTGSAGQVAPASKKNPPG